MGNSFDEAKAVAGAFVNAMGPNDIVDVMFFNDKGVVEDSKWVNTKAGATASLNNVPRTYPAQGRTRPLFNILKQAFKIGELIDARWIETRNLHRTGRFIFVV